MPDVWDLLKAEKRPICVYGMGNGADKLFDRLASFGITPAEVFASDGFVRGHSFRGYRVRSFSEVRAAYPDFVPVLSFASRKSDVLALLSEIDRAHPLVVPDMPVAGGEYFDRPFYAAHYDKILRAYALFCDPASRAVFSAVVNARLTGSLRYLLETYSEPDELYAPLGDVRTMLDLGAYNGDTVREAISRFPALSRVYAVEPDERNYKKLKSFADGLESPKVEAIRAAAWRESGEAAFSDSGNRNSSLKNASFEHKTTTVPLLRPDAIGAERVDFIKYDVEGAEREALEGSEGLILRDRPALLVSLYHRSEDLFALPLLLHEKYPFYRFFLRRTLCVPAWEIALLAIPEKDT